MEFLLGAGILGNIFLLLGPAPGQPVQQELLTWSGLQDVVLFLMLFFSCHHGVGFPVMLPLRPARAFRVVNSLLILHSKWLLSTLDEGWTVVSICEILILVGVDGLAIWSWVQGKGSRLAVVGSSMVIVAEAESTEGVVFIHVILYANVLSIDSVLRQIMEADGRISFGASADVRRMLFGVISFWKVQIVYFAGYRSSRIGWL